MKRIKTRKEAYINLSNDELIYEAVKEYDQDGNVVKIDETWHDQEEESRHKEAEDNLDAYCGDNEEESSRPDVQLHQRTDSLGRTIEFWLDENEQEYFYRVISPAGLVLFKADFGGYDQFFQYDSDGRLTDKYTLYEYHEHHEYAKSGNSETEIIISTSLDENHDFEDDIESFDDYYASVIENKAWIDGAICKRKEIRHTRSAHEAEKETIETEYLIQGTEENRSLTIDYLNSQGQTYQRRIRDFHNGKLFSNTIHNFDSSGRLVEMLTITESGPSVHMLYLFSEEGNLEKMITTIYSPEDLHQVVETRVSSYQYTYY